jgi:YHS domain-containing protein
MLQSCRILLWVVGIGTTVALSGCGSSVSQDKQEVITPAASKAHSPNALAGFAGLSDSDRIAAEKQRVCPVSGSALGEMGKPYKVTVKGQTVFLCCSGCEKQLLENPDKYLKKIQADKPE